MTKTKMELAFPLVLALGIIFMLSVCPTSAHQNVNVNPKLEYAREEHDHSSTDEESNLLTYIVHVQKREEDDDSVQSKDLSSWYHSLLPPGTNQQRITFSYRNVMNGFAVKLKPEEAKDLEEKEEVVSLRPEKVLSLQTTHTPAFLGLHQGHGLLEESNLGKGIIIGMLDTGINPIHPSFSDEGMSVPPAKWNGHCAFTGKRICNNKLIGARDLLTNSTSLVPPIDRSGHGTHTASTAAGRPVEGANAFGSANGTAVGVAPEAHLAIYKVCDLNFCSESSILAGMDIAIEDGVDVLSLSLGGPPSSYFDDPIARGAFHAIRKGIFVSCAAGNSGPDHFSMSNDAPWLLTAGASSTDRKLLAIAKLGNGKEFDGESMLQFKNFKPTLLPIVYAGANGNSSSADCGPGSLANVDVKGKVVLCEMDRYNPEEEVKKNGGAAMILINPRVYGYTLIAEAFDLPATLVSFRDGLSIKHYINSTSTPTATILFKGTVIGDPLVPAVTCFSSRGPSSTSLGILKPDIIGPGLNIIAAWTYSEDGHAPFSIDSGTSMSCPHLSGIAALLKKSHPDWSPAAIKSAIMTTANRLNLGGKPILDQRHLPADVFATGAGHVNPVKANDPGLVYDIEPNDYIPYLCGLGYSDKQIGLILNQKVKCSEVKKIAQPQLNYPSFSIYLDSTPQFYTRTLTNVGPLNMTYHVKVELPLAVDVTIGPDRLTFTEVNQKLTYSVAFYPQDKNKRGKNKFTQGSITWLSENYSVTIPIAVIFDSKF